MNGRDDNEQDGRDGLDRQLDERLAGYYRPIADAPVPVRLHGRIVRTIQGRAEGRRSFGRRPIRILGRLAPAALAVAVVATIALASKPFLRGGPASPASAAPASSAASAAPQSAPPAVSPSPAPTFGPTFPGPADTSAFPSGGLAVTVMNRGSSRVEVTIGGTLVGVLACGQSATYPASRSAAVKVQADEFAGVSVAEIAELEGHSWYVYTPGAFALLDAEPTGPAISICPMRQLLQGTAGESAVELVEPLVSGTSFDAKINAAIDAKTREWLAPRRVDLATIGTSADSMSDAYSVAWIKHQVRPGPLSFGRMLAITINYFRMLPNGSASSQLNWSGTIAFDLTDGHVIGINELFAPSTNWLSVLSAQSRELLGQPADGGPYAAVTAPVASNFENWRPTDEGISFGISIKRMTESAAQPVVTIPWSVLQPLFLPGSPIIDYVIQ